MLSPFRKRKNCRRDADLERGWSEAETTRKLAAVDHIGAVPGEPHIRNLPGKAIEQSDRLQQSERHRPYSEPFAERGSTHRQQRARRARRCARYIPRLPEVLTVGIE